MLDPAKFVRAQVQTRQDLSDDLWTVRLRPESPLSFRPGQYATLALEDDEGVHERPYSIVSSPLEAELEFFFELVPQGELTPRLHRLQPGDPVWMRRAAKGLFQLDRKSGHTHHLMAATVTGLAPFVSMLRTMASDPAQGAAGHEFLLLAAASRSWEFGYREEIERLTQEIAGARAVFSVSRFWEDAGWPGERGRVEEILRKYADAADFGPERTTAYLCGHPQMIENAKGILSRRGFAKAAVREEIYWIPAKSG